MGIWMAGVDRVGHHPPAGVLATPFGGQCPPYSYYSNNKIQGPPKVWGAGFTIPKANGGHAHPATVQHAHDSDADCPRCGSLEKSQNGPFSEPLSSPQCVAGIHLPFPARVPFKFLLHFLSDPMYCPKPFILLF